MLTSRKGPPLGAPGQIALAKIETSRAIKSVPDPGEISGVLIHVRRIFIRSGIPDKGLTSPRHPVEIRARSHQHHESYRRGLNRRYAVPRSSGDLGHIDPPPQTSSGYRCIVGNSRAHQLLEIAHMVAAAFLRDLRGGVSTCSLYRKVCVALVFAYVNPG